MKKHRPDKLSNNNFSFLRFISVIIPFEMIEIHVWNITKKDEQSP